MTANKIPADFWGQIDHQLETIATLPADTFAKVRAVLLDPVYGSISDERDRNGRRVFGNDAAFFAGSGGDKTLAGALRRAGWRTIEFGAPYYYVMQNTQTGETLTYIEGDVYAGDQIREV